MTPDSYTTQAVLWAARLETKMPIPPEQRSDLDREWKAFCIEERARWLRDGNGDAEPFEFQYIWNPHWFFDAHQRWTERWFEHIERVGGAWLAERGLRVAEWHSRPGEGLRIVSIAPAEQ